MIKKFSLFTKIRKRRQGHYRPIDFRDEGIELHNFSIYLQNDEIILLVKQT